MNRVIMLIILAGLQLSVFATSFELTSPNGAMQVNISTEEGMLFYELSSADETLISKSGIGLETDFFELSDFSRITNTCQSSGVDEYALYWGITSDIKEVYNVLHISFTKGISLEFRVYNNGIAWRFASKNNESFTVKNELAEFMLSPNSVVYFPEAEGFSTPFEANYIPHKLTDLQNEMFGITPLLIKTSSGATMVISEVDLKSYPGMFIEMNKSGLVATFPKYPAKQKEQILGRLKLTNIPQFSKNLVTKEKDYIAQCDGTQEFPWRAILVEANEKDLLSNNLIAALAEKPSGTEDYSWVKPGKVVWDWYHKWNLTGVDFKPGINTATYKYMIDFASENNLEYVNIDDGWCNLHNFRKINKELDLTEVIDYAHSKEIGIFLWCTWQTLEKNLDENINYFEELEISGLKVDFFDRADQHVVDFVNVLATKCAEKKLLLNLHGMYKPTGMQITYPNIVNFEGVLGLEYNKFSKDCTPTHNATIPYTRNVVGPMDYTPGGMRYLDSANFEKSWAKPHVMTTRTQQMAMYVIYHGGIQMLADSPTLYEKDPLSLNFLCNVPVTWDETVPIEGKIGKHVIIARRKGSEWYLAGLNSGKEMSFSIKTDFLPEGKYVMELLSDGDSAAAMESSTQTINKSSILDIKTKASGGFVARITLE